MELTLTEISEITKINRNLLNVYLANYRFTSFITGKYNGIKFKINERFLNRFEEYLKIKSNHPKTREMLNGKHPIDRLRLALKDSVA